MSAHAPRSATTIVIGGSAGALDVVVDLLSSLPAGFGPAILICLHLHPEDGGRLVEDLRQRTKLPVVEAQDKMVIVGGQVHVATADYHLLVERTGTLALSRDAKVNFCRPSIDVLFDSAARAYGNTLVALLLSGANRDGAAGMSRVRARGGLTLAQAPETAVSPEMPRAAIEDGAVAQVLTPQNLRDLLFRLHSTPTQEVVVCPPGSIGS